MSLTDRFAARMGALLGPLFPTDLAVAVSGGGDSMALLHLAAGWARPMGVRLWAVTVNHGLRAEAAAEAALVADEAAGLGVPHAVLDWRWDGQGNLQAAARDGRLDLIDRWRGGVGHVLFGHTLDDQAETVLMRLARGSGVDGLAAMADIRRRGPQHGARPAVEVTPMPPRAGNPASRPAGGFDVVRPLLTERRADLRHYLHTLRIPYAEDPTNDDPAYDRVKARAALAALAPLGVTPEGLAATATRMARAREALARRADAAREACVIRAHYDVVLDRDAFAQVERETQMRLLAAALMWIAGAAYRPRAAPLDALLDRALAGGGGTLHGAQVVVTMAHLHVGREPAAVRDIRAPAGQLWDGVWDTDGPEIKGFEVRALGEEGAAMAAAARSRRASPPRPHDAFDPADCDDPRRDPPIPRALWPGLPSIWNGPALHACGALAVGPPYPERRLPDRADFRRFLIGD